MVNLLLFHYLYLLFFSLFSLFLLQTSSIFVLIIILIYTNLIQDFFFFYLCSIFSLWFNLLIFFISVILICSWMYKKLVQDVIHIGFLKYIFLFDYCYYDFIPLCCVLFFSFIFILILFIVLFYCLWVSYGIVYLSWSGTIIMITLTI